MQFTLSTSLILLFAFFECSLFWIEFIFTLFHTLQTSNIISLIKWNKMGNFLYSLSLPLSFSHLPYPMILCNYFVYCFFFTSFWYTYVYKKEETVDKKKRRCCACSLLSIIWIAWDEMKESRFAWIFVVWRCVQMECSFDWLRLFFF